MKSEVKSAHTSFRLFNTIWNTFFCCVCQKNDFVYVCVSKKFFNLPFFCCYCIGSIQSRGFCINSQIHTSNSCAYLNWILLYSDWNIYDESSKFLRSDGGQSVLSLNFHHVGVAVIEMKPLAFNRPTIAFFQHKYLTQPEKERVYTLYIWKRKYVQLLDLTAHNNLNYFRCRISWSVYNSHPFRETKNIQCVIGIKVNEDKNQSVSSDSIGLKNEWLD